MLSRRSFVQVMGGAGASTLLGAQLWARGREAALGAGLDFDAFQSAQPGAPPIRLSSNENPVGPPRAALDAIVASLGTSNRYPSEPAQRLVSRLAALHGVDQSCIVVGAGSGEILRMAVYNWTSPARALVTAAPSFEEPVRYAELLGAAVVAVPVTANLKLDLDAMLKRVAGAGLVFLCNPNNPTGTLHAASDVTAFLDGVARVSPDTTVLIDEAYHHYVEDRSYASAISIALERPNVVVSRTFSKVYGMAGLRLGYAIARRDTIASLRRHRLANSVNALVAPAALAALDDGALVARERARNHEAREFTRGALAEAGYASLPSEANFIMVDIRRDVREFQAACLAAGVQIGRPFPPLTTYARISIGTMEEMSTAVAVFRKILAGRPSTAAAGPSGR